MKNEGVAPLRFVLLEDNAHDAELIQLELERNGMSIEWRLAASEADFQAALKPEPPDVVLADYALPGFDGLAALKIVQRTCPDIPFIFVSGSLGEERAIEALKSGATDYVLKDRLQRLPTVVNRALTEARYRRERSAAESALDAQHVLLRTLIDSLPDMVFAVNTDLRLTVVNQALLGVLRKERDEVLGRRLSELRTDEPVTDMEAQARTTIRTARSSVDQERAWMSRDGMIHWFMYTMVPLLDHSAVRGVVCAVREITAQKEMEQEILEISNREQRRLGSDLHDGLGQELTGLSLLLKGLEVQLSREADQYLPQIEKISELTAHAIRSTRSLARGLAPVNLERGGLSEALKHLAIRCTDMYSLQCSFTTGEQTLPELEESAATHLFRIAQEATTNAARYARATTIAIDLRTIGRKLQLSITDNGIGLSAGLSRGQPGMGLKIMEYRARMLGGSIAFQEPEQGTRILLSAPLNLLRQSKERMKRAI